MLSALSRHSQAIATLRCSFPEADIGNGAQHFGGADDCNADKVTARVERENVCFRLKMPLWINSTFQSIFDGLPRRNDYLRLL